jgi:hypothetical protein
MQQSVLPPALNACEGVGCVRHCLAPYESVSADAVAAALQVSFANSICTSKGGTHVNYVVDQITK